MIRSIQRCDEGSDMHTDLTFTLELVEELGRLKLANALAEALTLVHRPQFVAGNVVGLVGVDIVEVVKLVAAVRLSWVPSTRKGMSRV